MKCTKTFFLAAILLLIAKNYALASTNFSDRPKVIIAQIEEKKNNSELTDNEKWFSSFLKNYLHFRIGVSSNFDILTQNELRNPLNPDLKFTKTKITEIANEKSVNFLFLQSFYFTSANKINFYGEFIELNIKSQIYEKEFTINDLASELDSIALWYLTQANLLKDDKELNRFFKMKVIPDDLRELIKTGEILNISQSSDSLSTLETINELHEAVSRDPKNLLASFSAAKLYEKIGDFSKAAKEQNDLLMIIPFYAPLYSNVVKNFRITGNSQKALTFAANAEKKGIINPDLLLEGAITLEEIGIDRQASRAFFSILKLYPLQKRALLYFARASNRERLPKKALLYADSILAIDSIYGEALLEKGRANMLLSNYSVAEASLTKSTAYIEKPYEAMNLLGEINVLQQKYEKGALFFENAIKNGAISVTPYINGAHAWQLALKPGKAFTLLQTAHNLYSENPKIKKEFALISFTMKDSTEALELFEEYTQKFKQDPDILFPLGDIYTAQKNFQKAFFCFNQASQLTDDKSLANLKLGMFYLKKGDYLAAEKYLLERLKNDKADPIALSYLGEVKLKSGKQTEALEKFSESRNAGYNGTFCTEQIGLIHFTMGDHQKAFEELSSLENTTNGIPDLNYRLAVSSLFLKKKEQAIEYLRFASNNERASPTILLDIADGFFKLDDINKSIDVLTQAVKVYPKEPELLIQLSSLLEQLERYSEAATHLVSLYNIDNKRYGMHYAKAGFFFEKSGLNDSAIAVFDNFLNKGFKNDKVTKHLAALEFSKGNYKRTVNLLTQPELNLRKTENKQYLGEALYYLGNYGEALPYLVEIANLKKECPHCQANLAATYDALQRSDDAIKSYQKAIPLSTDSEAAEYSLRIANIYLKEDDFETAEIKFKTNISTYPNDLRNYDALVAMYSEQREWGKAADILKLVLSLPDPAPFYMKKLAFYYNKQNNRIEEEKILKTYLKSNPKDEEALIAMAYVNFDRDLFDKAASFFTLAENEKPLKANNTHIAGFSFFKSGDISLATDYFKLAIERGDSTNRNLKYLSNCYRVKKDTSNLANTLNKILQSGKREYQDIYELGIILTNKDSIQSGINLLEEASKLKPHNGELHLKLSTLYKQLKNQTALVSHLQDALKHTPNNASVLTFAGTYYRETGDKEKSYDMIKKALEVNEEYGEALYEMGLHLYDKGEFEQASIYTQKAIFKASYLKGVYTLHALVLNELKQHEKAISNILDALKKDSTDIQNVIAAGRIFFGAQNNELAKEYILKAITLSPDNTECFELMGDIYVHESAGSKAAEFYRKALKVSGFNEKIMMKLGDVLLSINENMQAQRVFSSILKNNAKSLEARFKLTFSCIRNRDISNAIKVANKFNNTQQKEMWQELTNGLIQITNNDISKAYSSFSIAYKLGPNEAITNTFIAKALLQQKKYDDAITHLEKSLNLNPFNPFALLLLGQTYEQKGDMSTAFNIYKKVSDKYSMIPETYNYLAGLRSKESKHDSAVVVIEKGLKVDPENGELYLALGRELKITGKKEGALTAYKKSIKYLVQADKSIYLEVAQFLYKDLNNTKDAIKFAKKYLKSGGTREELNKANLSDLEL